MYKPKEYEQDLERCKCLEKENKRLTDILFNISYQTPALGGSRKDMEQALLHIDRLCDLALRPDEFEEWLNERAKKRP